MDARGVRRSRSEEEEESYFVSMADMMVGLLFIFIILLLYFALQFQQKSKAISDAGHTRTEILNRLQAEIKRRAPQLDIKVDPRTGVLRLPASVLFPKNSFDLTPEGRAGVGVIAEAMQTVLPCYTYEAGANRLGCKDQLHSIDAIFVEGHTDSDPLTGSGPIRGNLELSALRATTTYRALTDAAPALNQLHNLPARDPASNPILSVSGYGSDRPIPGSDQSEASKSANRRIDLRFLMVTPQGDDMLNLLSGSSAQ